jgi:hypothetical protein
MPESNTNWQILSWIWERKDEIQRKLTELYSWFRGSGASTDPKPGILILGPGGSGKTTLGKLLAGEYDLLFDQLGRYDESLSIERYSLTDDPGVEIVVPPGQQHRREATWTDLHADIAAGKFRGIVLLTAYGYHTLGQTSYKDHRLYRGDKEEFLKAFLEDRRADELAILRQLKPHVRSSRGKMWLLTLVAKQDLWWPKRTEVEKHYREGEYGAEIQSILNQQDQRQFRHEFLFASLVISNFATGIGERLKANTEGYDHSMYIESLRRLFETVDALKNWELGQ